MPERACRTVVLVASVPLLVTLGGCLTTSSLLNNDAAGGRDSGTAKDSAVPSHEAGHDASLNDSGRDAAPADAGHDGGSVGADATHDAGHDAGHDSGDDAAHDAGHDAASTCSPIPAAAQVISWWRGEGNTADELGVNPGVWSPTTAAAYGAGKVGQAFAFTGIAGSSAVTAPTKSIPTGAADRTIELWVMLTGAPATASAQQCFVEYGTVGTADAVFATFAGASSQADFSPWGTLLGPAADAGVVTIGEWHHFAATSKSSVVSLYLDGMLLVSQAQSLTTGTASTLYIGGHVTDTDGGDHSTHWLTGFADEVTVYSTALTSTEIMAIVMAGSAGKCVPP